MTDAQSIPVIPVTDKILDTLGATLGASQRAWIKSTGFTGEAGSVCLLADGGGALSSVLAGAAADDFWAWAAVAEKLPEGTYHLDGAIPGGNPGQAYMAWQLAAYRFDRFKERKPLAATLLPPDGIDAEQVRQTVAAITLVRDLINMPANFMGPEQLAASAQLLADNFDALCHVTVGDRLLEYGYPAIHAVGRAAAQAPRLIDLRWGDDDHPKVTLVGKGVCFDTGGLDLKPASAMRIMKKDMGGAAHVLGLARMIMANRLPVRLRVLIPAVENSVSGNAMRPLDVIKTRKGLTVEIGHTDAEGRVVLADALAEASSEKPELILDCATLTGAARVALGTEIPVLFSNNDGLANDILAAGIETDDQLWRLPLWKGYRRQIEGKTADLSNDTDSSYGGAITAALFLGEFVGDGIAWAHVDMMAWNTGARPGRPEGGEAQGLRALFQMLARRFPASGR